VGAPRRSPRWPTAPRRSHRSTSWSARHLYVAEAKRQVAGSVGIASAFAGPRSGGHRRRLDPRELAAIDLMVQPSTARRPVVAHHLVAREGRRGGGGLEALVVRSPRRATSSRRSPRGLLLRRRRQRRCARSGQCGGPEHLELLFDGAESHLDAVRRAGAVFCGVASPASFGDYVAGPTTSCPRIARPFSSALRADDFRRHITLSR